MITHAAYGEAYGAERNTHNLKYMNISDKQQNKWPKPRQRLRISNKLTRILRLEMTPNHSP